MKKKGCIYERTFMDYLDNFLQIIIANIGNFLFWVKLKSDYWKIGPVEKVHKQIAQNKITSKYNRMHKVKQANQNEGYYGLFRHLNRGQLTQ